MIIRFWDAVNYEFPLIEINDNEFERFDELLIIYRIEEEDEYNFEGFLEFLTNNKFIWNFKDIDKEVEF